MKKILIAFFCILTIGIMSFSLKNGIQNKPIKIYRKENSKIVVWENKTEDDKLWRNYQVEM